MVIFGVGVRLRLRVLDLSVFFVFLSMVSDLEVFCRITRIVLVVRPGLEWLDCVDLVVVDLGNWVVVNGGTNSKTTIWDPRGIPYVALVFLNWHVFY